MPDSKEEMQAQIASILNTVRESLPSYVASFSSDVEMLQEVLGTKAAMVRLIDSQLGGNPSIREILVAQQEMEIVENKMMDRFRNTAEYLNLLNETFKGLKFNA